MEAYRVFISYSHDDLAEVEKIREALLLNGMTPMLDGNFATGFGFHEQIQTYISHAHVFMPYITESSSARGWVHQEIGYAVAQNIPVLPVTKNKLPGEMLQRLHAVTLGDSLDDVQKLLLQLRPDVFGNLVKGFTGTEMALYKCAETADDRTIMMIKYANDIETFWRAYGCVRQKGGLSSFNIPDKIISDLIWKERYFPETRTAFHCRNQRDERIILEKHAKEIGCRLIINPYIKSEQRHPKAHKVRLLTLLKFLNDMTDDKLQIVFNPEMSIQESLTIVGDYFAAESVSGSVSEGFRQTIFTCHAPSMSSRIQLFDQEFEELLQRAGWRAETSRSAAIEEIEQIISGL
ncbi:MAG: toll/interleukin-1 receptor domain-containing protein [Syntrophomonadaceae bacterium]|nr:toll/interleukin-1 receptor domain-containing protein [Syntrophomonadaceae bacterium]